MKMQRDYDSKIPLHLDMNNGLERVTELVNTRLVECGWSEKVRLACRKAMVESGERNNMLTVDELIASVTPKARAMLPDSVKRELLHELEKIMVNVDHSGYANTF